ncbi:MAG: hypothetical protein R2860_02645 [Desulfobacterales bacterium]
MQQHVSHKHGKRHKKTGGRKGNQAVPDSSSGFLGGFTARCSLFFCGGRFFDSACFFTTPDFLGMVFLAAVFFFAGDVFFPPWTLFFYLFAINYPDQGFKPIKGAIRLRL